MLSVRTRSTLRGSVPFAGSLPQRGISRRALSAELLVWPGMPSVETGTQLSLQNSMRLQPFFSASSNAFQFCVGGRCETALLGTVVTAVQLTLSCSVRRHR